MKNSFFIMSFFPSLKIDRKKWKNVRNIQKHPKLNSPVEKKMKRMNKKKKKKWDYRD